MTRISICVATIFLIAAPAALCQNMNEIDVEELKDKIKNQIPMELLPTNLQNMSLPNPEDIIKVLKDKCVKVTGSDAAFEEGQQALTRLQECLKPLVNFEEMQNEIKVAKPTGDLDTVFNKYCRKRSTAIECMNTFSNAVEPCLEDDEKQSKKVAINIFTNLLNFVCHKDGDQIALFIAEKGPECFTEKKDGIIECMNQTFSGYISDKTPTVEELPKFVMGKKECDDMQELQYCMVKVLEQCEESTPANLVESMFKFVKNETPCVNFTTARAEANKFENRSAGDLTRASMNVLLGTWLMALLAKFLIH